MELNAPLKPWKILLHQIKSPLVYILIGAAVVTLILREYTDLVVLSAAVIINTALGFYQEFKAEKTVEKLREFIIPKSLVEKDGKVHEVESARIKRNDIVILTEEYQIPADGKLVEGSLTVNEHILTGESIPIDKKAGDTVFLGTAITSGYAKMQVDRLAEETKFGEISKTVTETKEPQTPLQKQLSHLAKIISIVVLCNTLILFVIGILEKYPLYEILTTSVAVAVASVPEGLVIALTVILAVGMRNILKKKAVVKKLVAAETLGSVTTICVDKTGTITKGSLHVADSSVVDFENLALIVLYANNRLDTLDKAIYTWAKESIQGLKSKKNIEGYKQIDFLPFNSANKFTSSLISTPGGEQKLLVYGAAEILLKKSSATAFEKEEWNEKMGNMTLNGMKVIGFGYRDIGKDEPKPDLSDLRKIEFIGVQGLADPIRPRIKETLEIIKNAGIKLKLITGDHMVTALNIAREAGIISENDSQEEIAVLGDRLGKMNDKQFREAVENAVVFARVSPQQKFDIVDELSRKGEIVAMTGDGVNDAPALKRSAIGVVVNEASDVSKEVADIVLLDSNLKTIVHSIAEGRRIFANIRKVVMYLLSDSLTELILVLTSLLLRMPIAITAGQILWVNLIEDSLPALSLTMEPAEKDLLAHPPEKRTGSIFNKNMVKIMVFFLLITDLTLVGMYLLMHHIGLDLPHIRTVIFVMLGFDSLVYIFSCKSINRSIFKYNPFSNLYLVGAVLIGVVLLLVSVYVPVFNMLLKTIPLEPFYWGIILGFGALNLIVIESLKYIFICRKNTV